MLRKDIFHGFIYITFNIGLLYYAKENHKKNKK